jgi:hypothetical protein
LPKLLQLSNRAVCNYRDTFRVETIHHCREEFEFLLDGVGEEIGVDEDGIGRDEGGVVLKEEGGGYLWAIEILESLTW